MKKLIRGFVLAICMALLSPAPPARAATCPFPGALATFLQFAEDGTWHIRAEIEDAGTKNVSYNRLVACVEAIITELGILPKGTYGSVVLRLNDAVYLVGDQTIAGAKIFSGSIEFQQDTKLSGDISPAQIVADANDYNPASLSTASVLRLSSDAARSVTGLAGGADGRILLIHNVGAFNITFTDEDAASSAANRFALDAGFLLKPDRVVLLQYDATSSRWRCVSCRRVDLSSSLEVVGTLPDANLPSSMADKSFTGTTIIGERLDLSGDITPAQITANQNDYSPTGLATASTLRLSTDATRTITGIAGGADGRILVAHNVGGFNIILSDEDASSSAANRFALSANLTLTPDQSAVLHYDATSSRWRLFGGSGSGGGAGAPGGAVGDVQVNDGAGGFTGEAALNYDPATNQFKAPGVNIDEDFALTGDLTPAQLVADANDYSPAGLATASVLRVSGDASRAITGLATGSDGRVIFLHNVGAFNITLVSQSGLSIAANRFAFSANITIAPEDAAILQYDPTASRWRLVSGQPGPAGSAPGGAAGDCQFNNGSGGFTGEAPCNYDSALNQLNVPGLGIDEDLALRGDLSPPQITANQNDYAPTGFATATVLRLSTDASRNVTGIAGGSDGRLIVLVNVGSFDLVLVNESASSAAANRFTIVGNQTIAAGEGITLLYDSSSSRWRSTGRFTATVAGAGDVTDVLGTANEIDSASSGGPQPTLSLSPTLNLSTKVLQGATPLVFEGLTADAFETSVSVVDPTADRTVNIPNADSTTVQPDAGAASQFLTAISSQGVVSKAQAAFSDLSGIATPAQISQTVNAQTGTTYTYVDGDRGKLVTHTNAAAIAGTLPNAAGAGFDSGWFMDVQNRGAGTLTITPTTSTIDGAASLALTTGQGVRIFSDGTNYFTMRGIGGAGGSDTWQDEGTSLAAETTRNCVGRGIICDDNASKTRVRVFDAATSSFVFDETLAITAAAGSPFSFTTQGGAGSAAQASTAGHPGIYRLSTDSVTNDLVCRGSTNNSANAVHSSDTFDILIIAKLVENDANKTSRIGLMGATCSSDPPSNGIYLERLNTDTQWFLVTRSGGTQTRSTAIATSDTSWHSFRIYRKDASTIGAAIDGGTEQTNTTNIPSASMLIMQHVKTHANAVKSMDIDYVDLLITGLSR